MKQYRQLNKKWINTEWCDLSDHRSEFARCLLEHFFDHWFPTEIYHSSSEYHDGGFIIKKMKIIE